MIFLLILTIFLPLTCIFASWMMALKSRKARAGQQIFAVVLTTFFAAGLCYLLVAGFGPLIWHAIFIIWLATMLHAGFFLFQISGEEERS